MEIKLFQLGVIASVFLVLNAMPSRPPYVGCLDSNECGKGKCCTIGMGRYSIPRCLPKVELGDTCIPDHMPQAKLDLYYPDNNTVNLSNVYYTMCPCMGGLICSRDTGSCEDPTINVSFNYIDY